MCPNGKTRTTSRKKPSKKFGQIDLLVLNAGIWEGAPIEEMSEDLEPGFEHNLERRRGR
jgi:NAD(P)-dependent dehydrogenase (short-subunit alcohol dehydrogenase family)